MSLEFLSEGWIAKLDEVRAAAGEVETPDALVGTVVNVTVTGGLRGDVLLALVGGVLESGHRADAGITIILRVDLAKRMLIEGDQLAGLQGFMAGQIRIEGDASKLKALRTTPRTPSQIALQQKILEATA